MKQLRTRRAIVTFLCCLAAYSAVAQEQAFTTKVMVHWNLGLIEARIEYDIGAGGLKLPAGRLQAEREIAARMTHLIRPAILQVSVDSWRTIADCIEDRSISTTQLETFLESGQRTSATLSEDQTRIVADYRLNLHKLGGLLVRHSVPAAPVASRQFTPSREYSGILIYAQGSYHIRGEYRDGALQPCLFPRVFDDTMQVLLERNYIDPSALLSWGSVGWTTDLNDPMVEARVGQDPLRIMATELFGTRLTDVVLSRDDANKILASANNRDLIRQGRVLILYNP